MKARSDPMDAPTAPPSAAPAVLAPARAARQKAVADARRELVLAAAREAFIELGLEGASLREIAKRAGYSPGAIYSYFDSKEAVYGALLGESLERLNAHVAAAEPAADHAAERLRSKASAFFDFYREHPRDLDLGFYLFQGLQPRGLTPALNEALNQRLRDALAPAQAALQALGVDAALAQTEVTALFAHSVGLLLLSHTGRIRMFGQQSQALFGRYLDDLLRRVAPVAITPTESTP
ncbi:MAG: TetR/AcrR family transcriptional regulator [Leptothrix sp. (in: b-proteobacteria)]